MIIYPRQEVRGIGLFNKIRAYSLQDTGLDTVEASHDPGFPCDLRTHEVAAGILNVPGTTSVNLVTNNQRKLEAPRKHGIIITNRSPIPQSPMTTTGIIFKVKGDKLNHLF